MCNRKQLIARTLLFVTAAPLAISAYSLSRSPTASMVDPPATVTLTGVVRDFKERGTPGGLNDMEAVPSHGFGQYCDNIQPTLGADHKPVFKGGGFKLKTQWKNSAGKNICWRLYNQSLGDVKGSKESYIDAGGITSAATFDKWFNDDMLVNVSAPLNMTLVRQTNGTYVYNSSTDPAYNNATYNGQFFPIDGQLFGYTSGSPHHNYHFTFELHTEFNYDADANQQFAFSGDDDVFVFINGQLVIDLGGVHGKIEQEVGLNRLGLVDGEKYTLDFFFAERHRTESNFKITTNINLMNVELPTVSHAFD